ncbi:glycoside hydrolase family 17 protein [Mollisia scopiformis]|uniref:Probable glucan endo-1,3-beta-glucosidase eglC n=1 Tax=Mollisia scopiformis TaxID=149040 RepID=A0A194X0X0_MOLSC|nr:glycoside hydrolase family 17 protein [Mollisia scopiformis]KUJ13846.1 glycoside hydrolase family 17 protein [Mollisia scopiformis]
MKFKFLLPILLLTTQASAYWRGFSVKSYLADGSTCKSPSDWASVFAQLKKLPNKINAVRLYSSYTCNTLANAIPAAIASDTFLLVGILSASSTYDNEKGALLQAIKAHGWDWLLAVSVGSEDLYRGTISAASLAHQIYDVRGMLSELPGWNGTLKIGHVDTNNAWSNTSNHDVIRACDFVGTDVYPYFQTLQNNSISNAGVLFEDGVKQVRAAVSKAGSSASVWVTETGWPVNGATKNLAVSGTDEARSYWEQVACTAFYAMNTFWFTLQDFNAVPSFAVLGADGSQLYSQSC